MGFHSEHPNFTSHTKLVHHKNTHTHSLYAPIPPHHNQNRPKSPPIPHTAQTRPPAPTPKPRTPFMSLLASNPGLQTRVFSLSGSYNGSSTDKSGISKSEGVELIKIAQREIKAAISVINGGQSSDKENTNSSNVNTPTRAPMTPVKNPSTPMARSTPGTPATAMKVRTFANEECICSRTSTRSRSFHGLAPLSRCNHSTSLHFNLND